MLCLPNLSSLHHQLIFPHAPNPVKDTRNSPGNESPLSATFSSTSAFSSSGASASPRESIGEILETDANNYIKTQTEPHMNLQETSQLHPQHGADTYHGVFSPVAAATAGSGYGSPSSLHSMTHFLNNNSKRQASPQRLSGSSKHDQLSGALFFNVWKQNSANWVT